MSCRLIDRREFIAVAALAGGAGPILGQRMDVAEMVGQIRKEDGRAPIDGATWYTAEAEGAGFVYRFPVGTLSKAKYVVTDMLLDGTSLATFLITLHEGEKGRVFQYSFGGLNQCSFRVRMSLELVDQNRHILPREGGLIKLVCFGDRVDLDKVDRMVFALRRKGPQPVRWCMTPVHTSVEEVERIAQPILPKGVLLDEFGQSAIRTWQGKTRSVNELKKRIQAQYANSAEQTWPEKFSRWGGWKAKRLGEGSGFFRTHNDGKRWWLVDPDGYAFWSAGLDDVRVDCDARYDGLEAALKWLPDPNGEFKACYRSGGGRDGAGVKSVNYLVANLIRALGPDGWRDKWARIALAEMKRLRFNTVGNWSEVEYARHARFPYVRSVGGFGGASGTSGRRTPNVYREFPDVFHPDFEKEAAIFASGLRDTADDPALIGYFLMNEPSWGNSNSPEFPATGMLYNSEAAATRVELVRFLKTRYPDEAALSTAWKRPVTFDKIAVGRWTGVFGPEALKDLEAFSAQMVERYFRVLSQACKRVDPNHLNLGVRWAGSPPAWALQGNKVFDVFSLNRYNNVLEIEMATKIHDVLRRPLMIGEFHFGALDAGLPASGIGHVRSQEDRGRAYRVYVEDAAADPYCVGVHWFTLYDESALGRSDGENYNIGFLDICNRPYDALARAAIASHDRMYEVADGRAKPFSDAPEYLPKLW